MISNGTVGGLPGFGCVGHRVWRRLVLAGARALR
jgi:hypothetical protein